MSLAISVEGLSKQYRLGLIGAQSLRQEVNRWWHRVRGRKVISSAAGEPYVEGNIIWALRDVSFQVDQGDAVGIIGRNGAGKSTLLKILSGITSPTTGVVKLKGRVASLLEVGAGFHPELSGRDNIYLNGVILGMKKAEVAQRFDEIVAFSEIEKFIETPVKHYSSGMYVRLAFAVSAHVDAEILLVDEALAVGDAVFQNKCISRMKELQKSGRTVFFVSHNLPLIEQLCRSGFLLDRGSLIAGGDVHCVTDAYHNLIFDKTSIQIAERLDRSGSGRIRFTGLHWESSNGEIVRTLSSGEDYRLVLKFETNESSPMRNVVAAFSIKDRMGIRHLLHHTDFTKSNFDLQTSRGKFICTIPRFPLAEGEYMIGVFVGVGMETCDEVDDAARVIVGRGDFFGTSHPGRPELCKTLKECYWEIE